VYAPIPREGGLSACAEEGFGSIPGKFTAFVQRSRSIHPPSGTSYRVELTAACKPIGSPQPLVCGGIQGKQCPDTQQYCDFGAGQCKTADAQGTCKPKSQICPQIFHPFAVATARPIPMPVMQLEQAFPSIIPVNARCRRNRRAAESQKGRALMVELALTIPATTATPNGATPIASEYAKQNRERTANRTLTHINSIQQPLGRRPLVVAGSLTGSFPVEIGSKSTPPEFDMNS
jgi:hypothetical protein